MHIGYLFNKPTTSWSCGDFASLGLVFSDKLGEAVLKESDRDKLPKSAFFDNNKNVYINDSKQYDTMLGIVNEYNANDSILAQWIMERGTDLGFINDSNTSTVFDSVQLEDTENMLAKIIEETDKQKFDNADKERTQFIVDAITQKILLDNPSVDELKVQDSITEVVEMIYIDCSKSENIELILTHVVNNVISGLNG